MFKCLKLMGRSEGRNLLPVEGWLCLNMYITSDYTKPGDPGFPDINSPTVTYVLYADP